MLREKRKGSGALREMKEAEKKVADILGCHEWPELGEGAGLLDANELDKFQFCTLV